MHFDMYHLRLTRTILLYQCFLITYSIYQVKMSQLVSTDEVGLIEIPALDRHMMVMRQM